MQTKESPSMQNEEMNAALLKDFEFLERCHARSYETDKCLCCEPSEQTTPAVAQATVKKAEAPPKKEPHKHRIGSMIIIGICISFLMRIVLACMF